MNYRSIGDLALTFQNTRQNSQIKSDLSRLSQELASGQKSDISTVITGDYSPFVAIERSLKSLTAYSTATSEAGLVASAMQTVLDTIQDRSSELGPSLLLAGSGASEALIQTTTVDAGVNFEMVISALNTRVSDRSLFSGTATDRNALADVATIMASLETATATETTAAGIAAAVDNWFNSPGGGYDTIAYLGSASPFSPIRVSDNETAEIPLTGDDTAIRETLQGFAMAALIESGALVGNLNERTELARMAGENMISAQSALAVARAAVGTVEAQIDNAAANNAAETAAFEIARSNITAIDPFRTATELQAVSSQLETLYTLTARLSRLKLSDYL